MDNGDVPPDLQPTHPLSGLGEMHGLDAGHRALAQRLGAAAVGAWFTLPRDVQKRLFELAVKGAPSSEGLRGDIARFLHDTGGEG